MTRADSRRMQATRSTAQTVAIGNAKRGRDRVTCTNQPTPGKRPPVGVRNLGQALQAARDQGLETLPTVMPEVVFECPRCKASGKKQLCRIEMLHDEPIVTCNGCTTWGSDPQHILTLLGYDPDTTDEFEVALRVFDLLWALERIS